MEAILGIAMRKPISLRQFMLDYKTTLEEDYIPKYEGDIQNPMHLEGDFDRFLRTSAHCSLDQIKQGDDAQVTKFVPGFTEIQRKMIKDIPNDAIKLRTFQNLLRAKEAAARNPFHRSEEIFKLVKWPVRNDFDTLCQSYEDLIVTVRVYRPARATHVGKSLEKPVFAEEFECLGSNLLTELRDKISCVCNKNHFFDISENPNSVLIPKETDPGFFFITDTFYNDRRNPDNADYSEVIRNWAKKAIGLNDLEFKVAKMEETRFIDLTVSLGFPQLYQHHGNCEHVFTFSQVELITPGSQCLAISQFPRMRSFCLFNNRLCNMCGALHYVFIVEQSDRHLQDPAYLCSKCYESFHYINGEKIGKFKAYRVNDYANTESGQTFADVSDLSLLKGEKMDELKSIKQEKGDSNMS